MLLCYTALASVAVLSDADRKLANQPVSSCLIATPPLRSVAHKSSSPFLPVGTLCTRPVSAGLEQASSSTRAMSSHTSEEESLSSFQQQQAKLEACHAAGSSKADAAAAMPVVKKRRGHPGTLGTYMSLLQLASTLN